MAAIWSVLAGGVDEDAVAEFVRRAAPLLAGLGATSAALAAGYVRTLTGRRAEVSDLTDAAISQDLRHPFIGVYRDLGRGIPAATALVTGRERARALAQERVIQTQRRALGLAADGVTGWRRVPQGVTCAWCVTVSTRRYRSAEAASFGHGHKGVDYCDCDVIPIIGDRDPGQTINRPLNEWRRRQGEEPAYVDADAASAASRPS